MIGINPGWLSVRKDLFLLLASSILIFSMFGCSFIPLLNNTEDAPPEEGYWPGKVLEMYTGLMEVTPSIAFRDENGETRVLTPSSSKNALVAINMTFVNRNTVVVPMLVNENSVEIGNPYDERFRPIDPFENAMYADVPEEDLSHIKPFLWGSMDLVRDFQIEGYLIFEIPQGMPITTLWWEEVDSIVALLYLKPDPVE